MVMTVPSQAEWMALIEQRVFQLGVCVCGEGGCWWEGGVLGGRPTLLQMAAVSMAAIKRWEVSGQG